MSYRIFEMVNGVIVHNHKERYASRKLTLVVAEHIEAAYYEDGQYNVVVEVIEDEQEPTV